MKIKWMFFLTLLFLLFPLGVGAQSDVSLQTLQIDLWAEYDRQSVLVIYQAVLSPAVRLPAEVMFRIPVSAGEPNAVVERADMESRSVSVPYTAEVMGEWQLIRMTVSMPGVQIEYYDDAIVQDGVGREFVYRWPGDYAVESLAIFVQQPVGANDIRTTPPLSKVMQNNYGLFLVWDEIGAIDAGQSFEITVHYEKDSDDLTVNYLPLESVEPLTANTAGRVDMIQAVPWGVGVIGLGVILIGVWWYRNSSYIGLRRVGDDGGGQRRAVEPALRAGVQSEGDVFCQVCGKRADVRSKFCRACGTKLR